MSLLTPSAENLERGTGAVRFVKCLGRALVGLCTLIKLNLAGGNQLSDRQGFGVLQLEAPGRYLKLERIWQIHTAAD